MTQGVFQSVSRSVFLTSAVAMVLAIAAPRAEAREFYTLGVKAKLVYSHIDGTNKKMGSIKGELRTGDDGSFAELVLDGQSYPVTFGELRVGEYRRPRISVILSRDSIFDIMRRSNHSWLRKQSLKARVSGLIERFMGQVAADATYCAGANYTDHHTFADSDNTATTFQFHDDSTPESLHLTIDFASRVSVN